MGVSKVEFGGETLVDLTNDTVNPQNLLKGATAHGANGDPINGNVVTAPTTTSLTVTEEGISALDGVVGKTLNDKGAQINVYKGDDGMLHFRDWNGADTGIPFNVNMPEILIPLISAVSYNPELYVASACDFQINVKNYKKMTCSRIESYGGNLTLYLDGIPISLQPEQETLIDGSIFRVYFVKPLNVSNPSFSIHDLRFYN